MPNKDSDLIGPIIQSLVKEVRDGSVALASFASELKSLKISVDKLSKIVHDGNGHSLVTKVAVLEDQIQDVEPKISTIITAKLSEFDQKIENDNKELVKDTREAKYQKFQFWGAIIPAVLSLVISVIVACY